jgi:DnaK suppressor protein
MKKKKAQTPKKKAKAPAAPKARKKAAKSMPKAKAAIKLAKAAASRSALKVVESAPKPAKREMVHKSSSITLPPDYRPTDKEPFMNTRQLEYFRRKLLAWRLELLKESEETLESLQEGGLQEPDLADRASAEMERALELRTRDRARKLISKIDAALHRIEDGSYGYCEETSEPIGLKRLEARPIATLSVEAQERHERMERTHRSD